MMKAADIMISNVITVTADSDVVEVAKTLLSNRISGVPVIDKSGRIVGIVSEGDLLRRAEVGTERHRSWWLQLLTSKETLAQDFVQSHGRKVGDVMTRGVVTVAPDTPLSDVATALEKHGIKRVPVVKDGKLVGIVSRANLLQALASMRKDVQPGKVDDATLRDRVVANLDRQPWTWPALINVIVRDENVELWGLVNSETEKNAVRIAAEGVAGVKSVSDNLRIMPRLPEA
jgi:CBS domain-containing protein